MEPQEIERALADLELQIDRVRALYEQYFLGMEKLEPHVPRKNLERLLQQLMRVRLRNTAQRFRYQQLVQRYNTMQTYWRRVARQIEEGTYRRDVMRARARSEKHRQAEEGQAPARDTEPAEAAPGAYELDDPGSDASLEASIDELFAQAVTSQEAMMSPAPVSSQSAKPQEQLVILDSPPKRSPAPGPASRMGGPSVPSPSPGGSSRPVAVYPPPRPGGAPAVGRSPRPSAPPPVPPPRPPATGLAGRAPQASLAPNESAALSEQRIRALYDDYLSARRQCNQSVAGLSLEKVAQQIRSQESVLRQQHGAPVDFKVEIRDGKALFRARRQKG